MPKAASVKKPKSKAKAGGAKQAGALAPSSVFVWAQCDNAGCQKWRKLPPSSVIEDDVPWFCYMNPDPDKDRCSADEESWNRETEEGHDNITGLGEASSPAPKTSSSNRGNTASGRLAASTSLSSLRRADSKRKVEEDDPPFQPNHGAFGHAPKRQRTGGARELSHAVQAVQAEQSVQEMPSPPTPVPPDPGRVESSHAYPDARARHPPKNKRGGIKAQKAQQGFDKLLAGGGEWEIVKGRGRAITPAPAYIWDALASHAPVAAELACSAANAASAAKYFEDPVEPQNDAHMQAAALTCRVAMVAAAALASEEAAITTAEPSSIVMLEPSSTALLEPSSAAPPEGEGMPQIPKQEHAPGSVAMPALQAVFAQAQQQQQQQLRSQAPFASPPAFMPSSFLAAASAAADQPEASQPQRGATSSSPAQGIVSHLLAQAAMSGNRLQLAPSFPAALSQPSLPQTSLAHSNVLSQPHVSYPVTVQMPQQQQEQALASVSPSQRLQMPAANSATAGQSADSAVPPGGIDSAPDQSAPQRGAGDVQMQASRLEQKDADQHRPPDSGLQASDAGPEELESDSDSGIGGACMALGSVHDVHAESGMASGRNGLIQTALGNGVALPNGKVSVSSAEPSRPGKQIPDQKFR